MAPPSRRPATPPAGREREPESPPRAPRSTRRLQRASRVPTPPRSSRHEPRDARRGHARGRFVQKQLQRRVRTGAPTQRAEAPQHARLSWASPRVPTPSRSSGTSLHSADAARDTVREATTAVPDGARRGRRRGLQHRAAAARRGPTAPVGRERERERLPRPLFTTHVMPSPALSQLVCPSQRCPSLRCPSRLSQLVCPSLRCPSGLSPLARACLSQLTCPSCDPSCPSPV